MKKSKKKTQRRNSKMRTNSSIKSAVVALFLILAMALPLFAEVHPEHVNRRKKEREATSEIQDRSIMKDFMGAEAHYPRNTGFFLDIGNKQSDYAWNANIEVLKSLDKEKGTPSDTKKYSLFDLYGPDIHFFRYMGESTVPIELPDHIYSAFSQNKADKLHLGDTIFYTPQSYLSCRAYSGRPNVLSDRDIKIGKRDPRVETRDFIIGQGYSYVAGSFKLSLAKYILMTTNFLIGTKPVAIIEATVDKLTDKNLIARGFRPIFLTMLGLAIIAYIFTFGRMVSQYLVGSSNLTFGGKRGIFGRILIFFLCLVLFFGLLVNPMALKSGVSLFATVVDEIFATSINQAVRDDEVTGGTDSANVVEAVLWKKTIFEPWCMAQFNRPYDKLYTQFSDKPSENKLPQSSMSDKDIKMLGQGKYGFNSSKYTGDVSVPVGNNTFIKNWAAFLYSAGSQYHINHDTITMGRPPQELTFPNYVGMGGDVSIPADVFRVVDAVMNISPQIYNDGSEAFNYTDSHMVVNDFQAHGRDMLFRALLLAITMLPSAWTKVISLFKLFTYTFQVLMHILIELASPNARGLGTVWENIKTQLAKYFYASLRLFVLITLYITIIDGTLLKTIVYLVLAIQLYSISFKKVKAGAKRVRTKIRTWAKGKEQTQNEQ